MRRKPRNPPIPTGPVRSFEEVLRELGLTRDEWQQLKNVVLEGSYGYSLPIPEALAGHKVAQLVMASRRAGTTDLLYDAAALLVGGSKDGAMLALDKS